MASINEKAKMNNCVYRITCVLILMCCTMAVRAQEAVEPRPSPLAIAAFQQGDTYIKIVYSRPHKRGRQIFGSELAPYGKVWRFGANESTEITLTGDIKVKGKTLNAGTYSMYVIPEEDEWTIIFNRVLGEWGAFNYDQRKDALRVKVPTRSTPVTYEPLTILFDERGTNITVAWDDTQVVLPIRLL